jgi:hypothetical protein
MKQNNLKIRLQKQTIARLGENQKRAVKGGNADSPTTQQGANRFKLPDTWYDEEWANSIKFCWKVEVIKIDNK